MYQEGSLVLIFLVIPFFVVLPNINRRAVGIIGDRCTHNYTNPATVFYIYTDSISLYGRLCVVAPRDVGFNKRR